MIILLRENKCLIDFVCIKVFLALDYVSGSSKNDVTMTEQVSIVKRAKFIVRNKPSAPYLLSFKS